MALIDCPECGGKVSDKAPACIHCGFPLKEEKRIKYCPYCGKENDEESEFCGYCGKSFVSSSNDKVVTSTVQEKRRLSDSTNVNVVMNSDDLEIKRLEKERLEAETRHYNSLAKCPKCGSTSLTGNKKGFGVGKAAVGVALTGGVGLLVGGIGANKVIVTCMNCGHKFTIS